MVKRSTRNPVAEGSNPAADDAAKKSAKISSNRQLCCAASIRCGDSCSPRHLAEARFFLDRRYLDLFHRSHRQIFTRRRFFLRFGGNLTAAVQKLFFSSSSLKLREDEISYCVGATTFRITTLSLMTLLCR
jgi:hypothetical protein